MKKFFGETLEYLISLLKRDFEVKILVSLGAKILEFFLGDLRLALALIVMVLLDTITGVVASYRTGKVIESAKFGRVIVKLYVYFTLVITGVMLENLSGLEFTGTVVYTFILVNEGISVLENLDKSFDIKIVKILLNKLRGIADDKEVSE